MDLLTLALLCGPMVAPETTFRVIQMESGGHVYAIHDNTDGRSYQPRSLTEAERIAIVLVSAGHSVDLGLMQVNYQVWLRPARVRLDQALNPCTNVALGTTILSAAYARALTRHSSPSDTLKRALSTYNSGSEDRAREYADRIFNPVIRSH